tara:strand:- start:46 stop:321 length:276 start_codon:yes stop_codon:yes gene_type:complete
MRDVGDSEQPQVAPESVEQAAPQAAPQPSVQPAPQPAAAPQMVPSGKKFSFGMFLKILLLLLIVGGALYLLMNPGGLQAIVDTFFGRFSAQ